MSLFVSSEVAANYRATLNDFILFIKEAAKDWESRTPDAMRATSAAKPTDAWLNRVVPNLEHDLQEMTPLIETGLLTRSRKLRQIAYNHIGLAKHLDNFSDDWMTLKQQTEKEAFLDKLVGFADQLTRI
jgi:acyl carrier protein phosphodiesterase